MLMIFKLKVPDVFKLTRLGFVITGTLHFTGPGFICCHKYTELYFQSKKAQCVIISVLN